MTRFMIIRQYGVLEKTNLVNFLFDSINQQLAEQSIIVKNGSVSIIDATVLKALNNRPNKKACANTQDKDASYNVKTGSDGKMKTTYGFKGHIACDEDGLRDSDSRYHCLIT